MPPNLPEGKVAANIVGVTNAAKKFAGMVGVRFNESKDFGPTAEKFEGTNIIGEVINNLDALKGVDRVAYVSEVPSR